MALLKVRTNLIISWKESELCLLFVHEQQMDWWFGSLIKYDQQWHGHLWCHWYQQVSKGKFGQYVCYKKKTAHEGMSSWWQSQVVWTTVHEVLHQSWCEPFLLSCKVLQGSKISSNWKNNIVIHSTSGDIVLDCQNKTCDGWVAGVKFLWDTCLERAGFANSKAENHGW